MNTSYELNLGTKYSDSLPTLGEVIADVIRFFGGKRIYGVGGDFAANLIAALEDEVDICPSSNEMHAGFSACAQAEVDGLGFCLTTYMVGSLPCTSAAALAVTEGFHVVIISGAPGEVEVNSQAIHHTIHPNASWKTDYDNALEAFSALGVKVERLQGSRAVGQPNVAGKRFYHLVAEAYRTKQPVFIEVPRDQVQCKTQLIKLPNSLSEVFWGNNVLTGSDLVADVITDKLTQAKAPLLYIGDRLKHNEKLKAQIIEFSNKFNIPYATSWFAKGIFDEYQPLCLGAYNGVFTQTSGRVYIEKEVDYIIDIATSIFPQDSNTAFGTGSHKVEHFANKTLLKGGTLLERDLMEIFAELLTRQIPRFKFTMLSDTKYESGQSEVDDNEDIDFNNLASTLNELQASIETPLVYLPEVGNSYFASYSLKVSQTSIGRSWLTNPWYGAMGTALPYARVVAQRIQDNGEKDRAVVIIGDGGFHFQLNELIHFLKDQTNVTIIYMRNNVFHLGKSGDSKIYHCNDKTFDVHSIIKAYQGNSSTCQSVAEFKNSFKKSLTEQGISLIEVLAKPIEERQCNELRLLNLYIKAKNGNSEAVEQWEALLN
jgi:TPP-dependent 2-oxoacid decarboxylase